MHELREDPIHELHYTNYIFIQSNEDVRWLLLNQSNEDPLDMLVEGHRSSTIARPATPSELRHTYLAPNAVSNWANTIARGNVNLAAQLKAKAIPMNHAQAGGSPNPQDSPLFLPGWSSSSSDISVNFDSHHSRIVCMTSC